MNRFDSASEGERPIATEIRANLLAPFIVAVSQSLQEMAGTEVVAHAVYQQTSAAVLGDVAAVIGLTSARTRFLILSFPRGTASALAGRILAEVTQDVDEDLVRDCVGEIANVIAGQAKALLADTPYRFTFCVPQVLASADDFRPPPGLACLVIAFRCEHGDFTMQIHLHEPDSASPKPSSPR